MKNKTLLIILSSVLISTCLFVGLKVFAATNIDSTNRWAWNDLIGWIDFYSTRDVYISSDSLIGNASSSVGYISFDCDTSPDPPANCSEDFPDWKVTIDALGNFSGWAWNDEIGWISFDCHDTTDNCVSSLYQVELSGQEFTNWAWNDVIGWISFNCSNTDTCGDYDYKVAKSGGGIVASAYLVSSVFDTGIASGVVYNTLLYQGSKPTGTQVGFQFASSDSVEGPWNFSGYDGTDTTYYTSAGSDVPIILNPILYSNKRYFKYKIFLDSNLVGTVTPEINDVIVTWSR